MIVHSSLQLLFGDVFLELSDFLPDSRVLLKLEGFTVGGSIKFKPAVEMVEALERAGQLRPGKRIIESSSGNMGLALSVRPEES
jgi:cysteine synthase